MDKKTILAKLENWKKLYKAAENEMETARNRFYQIAGQKNLLEALLMEIDAKECKDKDESLPDIDPE